MSLSLLYLSGVISLVSVIVAYFVIYKMRGSAISLGDVIRLRDRMIKNNLLYILSNELPQAWSEREYEKPWRDYEENMELLYNIVNKAFEDGEREWSTGPLPSMFGSEGARDILAGINERKFITAPR